MRTLRSLHFLHPVAIPFENLDPLLGRPVPLDVPALEAKLVRDRRGGYCFEQNTLFAAVLEALGFRVAPLAARVRWGRTDGTEGPRTHMLLRVDLAGESYIADVGFGGFLLSAPVRLEPDVEQTMPGATVRLVVADGSLIMQAKLPAGWQDMYRFTLERQLPVDYEVANWFTSAHPSSPFTRNLLVQRLTADFRYSLFNRQLTVRGRDGKAVERRLDTADDLTQVLRTLFNITPPAEPAAIWNRLAPG